MACYAALLSLSHTLNNIKIHPRPPISLDQNQVESLTQNLTFFQHFLESNPTYEDDDLETRIANAAYAAEDVIETHIVDQISAREHISAVDLSQGLERVIKDMDLIRNEVMQINKHKDIAPQLHDQLPTISSVSGGPAASTWQSITPVFDEAMIIEVLDKLAGQQSSLQIIPIVGMGGIGKTTFATSLYTNPLIVQHFDIRAWVTISQEYSVPEILRQVLGQGNKDMEVSENELGEKVHKKLWGRRYCIVMDDVWSVEALDQVRCFFPENSNGSRIMITTRLTNLAFQLSGNCHVFQMQFLDEDESWELLSEIVFGKQDCPVELESIGKEIAGKCKGLPLSIVVIGGRLKKNKTQAYWISTLENLNSLINLENDQYALRLLRTSYKELPMHLKPCFLYIGFFPEDEEIKISLLIRLWVAEGILRPVDDKSSEEVAEEYLKELIDRNLILTAGLRWDGKARLCKIHDLLRDVCLREAQKQKFFCLLREKKNHTPQDINMERRICISPGNAGEEYSPEFLHAVETASLTRSLLYTLSMTEVPQTLRFRLLRICSPVENDLIMSNKVVENSRGSSDAIFEQANMRYLFLGSEYAKTVAPRLLSLCSLLWNLQTLMVYGRYSLEFESNFAPKIWEMPLLRHVVLYESVLPDPPNGEHNYVLENLQKLKGIKNLKFSEEVVKRIPNIKKLDASYHIYGLEVDYDEGLPDFCLHNLGRLQKLESLRVGFSITSPESFRAYSMSFPHSLKKLSLKGTKLNWEELTKRIGPLPLLQLLKLEWYACVGSRWETIEGQFCSLRVLEIEDCRDLKYWETDSSHFPCLEHLRLYRLTELEEIPSSIGDIPTLKSMRVEHCYLTAVRSARRIKKEQEDDGNVDLQVAIEFNLDDYERMAYQRKYKRSTQYCLNSESDSEQEDYGNEDLQIGIEDSEEED